MPLPRLELETSGFDTMLGFMATPPSKNIAIFRISPNQTFQTLTVNGKKNHRDWQHKNDISLFIMKPTILIGNLFYLKVIIFGDIIGQRWKCLTLSKSKSCYILRRR